MFNAKNLFRTTALIIALVMVFSLFTACGKQGEPEPTVEPTEAVTAEPTAEPTPEPTADPKAAIVGRWAADYNLADAINAGIAADESGMYGDLHISDAFIKLYFTFNEDGSYEMEPEEESYKAAMKQVTNELIPVLKDMVIAMFSAFAEEGQELSEEDILAALEIDSWDEFGEQVLEEMGSADDELSMKGMYELEGSKLSLSNGEGQAVDASAQTIVISIDGSKLTFESVESTMDEGFTNEMMPIVFNKAD